MDTGNQDNQARKGETMTTIQTVTAAYAGLDAIPLSKADKLIATLEAANTDALQLIYTNRVKFCWMIARRILRDRGEVE